MASAPTSGAVAEPPKLGDLAAASPIASAGTAAWLCVIPCAIVVLLAILFLGPPLGSLVHGGGEHRFLPSYAYLARPEPTEQGRYLVALSAPLLLSLATATVVRLRLRLSSRVQRTGVIAAQLTAIALVAICIREQLAAEYGPVHLFVQAVTTWRYLTPATLAFAAAFALLTPAALRPAAVRRVARRSLRRSATRGGAVAATLAATAATAIWLLHAVHTDDSIANAPASLWFHMTFTLDEAFAIINGRTPLVDFSSQYASLLSWVGALAMLAFGKTTLVFTIAMCTLTCIGLLAMYDVLRRVTRSPLAALVLYLPFLATSLYKVRGTAVNRDTFATYFGAFPLRFAGPYVLAWLTIRQLEQRGERAGSWSLFAVAGLVLLNNFEIGLVALGASIAAIVWARPPDRSRLLRLGAHAGAGLVVALALVCALTLIRAGSWPRLWRLWDYVELYSRGSFGMLPMHPTLGLHVAIYVTYVAAIATATVRTVSGAPNRLLTAMLAWSGVFGLGAGSYFVGRSHMEALITTFSAWALAIALLTAVVVPWLLAATPRRPSLGALLVLFGFGIAICSLAQTPAPWSQLARFDAPFTASMGSFLERPLEPEDRSATRRFVSSVPDGHGRFVVRPGAPVALLMLIGHRVADAYGLVDVSPYTGLSSMETEERVEATIDALRDAGGSTVVVPRDADTRIFLVLARNGFRVVSRTGGLLPFGPGRPVRGVAVVPWQETYVTKWVDVRHRG